MSKRHQSLIPLSHQHHHGLVMSLRLRQERPAGLSDPAATVTLSHDLIDFFDRDLAPHFAAEEEALFPAMERHLGKLAIIEELRQEHQQMIVMIEQMRQSSAQSSPASLWEFGDLLHDHIGKEERILFTLFEERIPDEIAVEIGQQIVQVEEECKLEVYE
jgi:hemerythrin-like domain-containing protein